MPLSLSSFLYGMVTASYASGPTITRVARKILTEILPHREALIASNSKLSIFLFFRKFLYIFLRMFYSPCMEIFFGIHCHYTGWLEIGRLLKNPICHL